MKILIVGGHCGYIGFHAAAMARTCTTKLEVVTEERVNTFEPEPYKIEARPMLDIPELTWTNSNSRRERRKREREKNELLRNRGN